MSKIIADLAERDRKTTEKIIADLAERDLVDLAKRCARRYDVTLREMLGRTHGHAESSARALLWAVLYARGHWSFPRLALTFDRDHTTVLHGVQQVPAREVAAIEPKKSIHEEPFA